MSKNKDIKEEIVSRRERTTSFEGHEARFYQLDKLIETGNLVENDVSNLPYELSRYFPVSAIALTESFFRFYLGKLIDHDLEYLERAIKIVNEKGKKFDLKFLQGLHDRSVTIGEILSNLVTFNNYEDITHIFSKILDDDFIKKLESFVSSYPSFNQDFLDPFKKNKSEVIQSVIRNFNIRHILAHEFATDIVIEPGDIIKDYENQKIFIRACNVLFKSLLNSLFPIGSKDLEDATKNKFEEKTKELESLLQIIYKNTAVAGDYQFYDMEKLKQAVDAWKSFRDSYALTETFFFFGNSLDNLIGYEARIKVTQVFIDFLKNDFKSYL